MPASAIPETPRSSTPDLDRGRYRLNAPCPPSIKTEREGAEELWSWTREHTDKYATTEPSNRIVSLKGTAPPSDRKPVLSQEGASPSHSSGSSQPFDGRLRKCFSPPLVIVTLSQHRIFSLDRAALRTHADCDQDARATREAQARTFARGHEPRLRLCIRGSRGHQGHQDQARDQERDQERGEGGGTR